ncbi:hypothetical protein DCO48_16030 [Pseudomonas sp. SDI]|uniref:S-type pyocin domain-containing protein n=1 Tax=Pseudomonas sp. SDI TaxID=2170734 RepID=UPI000DE6ED6F|nr:S-type pyocin domain-containing protein [Pseudomonas sp. SDI]PWB31732.1 hypothetical protein DCO48_16030 [Pseudomonas sp. SDI]
MKRPQKWIIGHGGADSADHLVYLTDDEIRQRDARNRKLDDEAVEQVQRILVNPQQPPEYQDAIIWFPSSTGILPIYISLNVRNGPGVVT